MKNYSEDFKHLFSIIKNNLGINTVTFEESAYDRDEDRPTYHDDIIISVWLDGSVLNFTTEHNGYYFVHEVDLITLISLVNGEDMDKVALDYIFCQVLEYTLGENYEGSFDPEYFDSWS